MLGSTGNAKVRNGETKKRVVTAARREQNKVAQRAWKGLPLPQNVQARSLISAIELDATQNGRHENLETPRPKDTISSAKPLDESGNQSIKSNLGSPHFAPPDLLCEPLSSSSQGSSPFSEIEERATPQPDLKLNTLQTSQTRTLLAILNNAICLGFDVDSLMNCSKGTLSPFFRRITPTDNPQDLIATVLNPLTPVHLQPTMAQMLIPHHPALDLVPLPLVRDRLITLCFAMPNVYDLWELKLDIYVQHGLVFKSDNYDCLSWDRKSWEIKPWFGEKWGIPVCE
ncbi:hypothetical protein N7478_000272 [Penicillium angulare]|uniref:uncharacterized protein n=1 Tax=Penicillium angulare TaxID=116970 RepID=UPI002542600D|nr:uncharacterized protein N7478_000272 [Penicillium angulare]KAJ5291021.1 hypothetical protein N7478_000272 [Penicillium angulare]